MLNKMILLSVLLISTAVCIQINANVLYLSDLHYDIYYDSTVSPYSYQCKVPNQGSFTGFLEPTLYKDDLGKYYCDTNRNLLSLVIRDALKIHKQSPFSQIIIMGDLISHLLYKDSKNIEDNYTKTLKEIKDLIRGSFLGIPIMYIPGNNDFTTRYSIPNNLDQYSSELKRMEEFIAYSSTGETLFKEITLVINSVSTQVFAPWYSFKITSELIGIAFDSVLWSVSANSVVVDELSSKLADAQLDFIKEQIQIAQQSNQKIIFHNHIPIHCNFFDSKYQNNWHPKFSQAFDELMKNNSDTVALIFSSHIHVSPISVRRNENNYYMPVLSLPAISPSNNSSPGFAVAKFTSTESYEISYYYLDLIDSTLTSFIEFNLRDELNIPNFKASTLALSLKWRDSIAFDAKQHLKMYSGRIRYNTEQIIVEMGLKDNDIKSIFCSSYIIQASEADSLCK